jgi:Skp family chaperone for outer membrane proteins
MKLELSKINASNAVLAADLSAVQMTFDGAQLELSALRFSISQLAPLKDAVQKFKARNSTLRNANCELQSKIDSLKSDHFALRKETDSLKQLNQSLSQ